MFYLVQHIWFCLLLAAALGAFLMWLMRAWSKEEKASDLVIGWETRLDAFRNENTQIKAQLQASSAKASLLSGLQADFNRQQQQNAELGSQREAAEKAWTKKYGDLETDSREKVTSMETQLAGLRAEFAALAHERDVLTSECDRLREAVKASEANSQKEAGVRQDLAAAQLELASLRADVAMAHETQNQWREKWHEAEARHGRAQTELAALAGRQSEAAAFTDRFAELEAESNQARMRLSELTSENERLREELQRAAGGSVADGDEALRKRLAAAEQETANLKSHLSTASYLQDEWRNKWHDVEAKYAAAQAQIAAAASRVGALSGLESENVKLQSELASRASQYTLLRAEADLHVGKLKELSNRLAALEPESHTAYDKAG